MHSTTERRLEILEILNEQRSVSPANLQYMFGVDRKTIYRDIIELSCSYQILTQMGGRNGAGCRVYLPDGYSPFSGRLNGEQLRLLDRLSKGLSEEDMKTMQSIIDKFGRKI